MIKLPDGAINASPDIHKAWVDLNGNLGNHNLFDRNIDKKDSNILYVNCEGTYFIEKPNIGLGYTPTIICTVGEFKEYCETMREMTKPDLIAQIEPNGFPPVGYTLKFTHDYFGDFNYLHSAKYEWRNGDPTDLVCRTAILHGGHGVIGLITQGDVLSTAVISVPSFLDTGTESEK